MPRLKSRGKRVYSESALGVILEHEIYTRVVKNYIFRTPITPSTQGVL